jgi:glycosyltransferase involved in cell wall biosynthesis
MKNVAIINNGDAGSTGNIAKNLQRSIREHGYNCVFCYGRGERGNCNNTYRIDTDLELRLHAFFTRITGLQGFYSNRATSRLIALLKQREVDTIYIVCIHGYYLNESRLYEFIAKYHIRLIHIMIDEYAFTGKCAYTNNCKRYLYGCGLCVHKKEYPSSHFIDGSAKVFSMKKNAYSMLSNATFVGPQFVVNQAKSSPLFSENKNIKLGVLDEAVDMDIYYPRDTSRLRKELNIRKDTIIICCVVPYYGGQNERKGGHFFIELARRFEKDSRFMFVHVGYCNNQSEELPINYIPISFLKDQDLLAEYFSLGDLFVFPSLLDTMPNACLDALACGTPLLCFDVSGMPYIANDEVGTFVEAGNIDELFAVVNKTHHKTDIVINKCREYALSRYDSKQYNEKLIKLGKDDHDSI